MAKSVTLADIAAEVGVSNVAVSKALSGKPGVSDELRARIKEIAENMGYMPASPTKPNAVSTGNIGVLIPDRYYGHTTSFYGQLYEKVVKALFNNHYYGILELLETEDEAECSIPKVVQDEKVDGLILLGTMGEAYIKKMAAQTVMPVYFLDSYIPAMTFDTVISDGYYGMYELTSYLISQGHRKIAFVGSVDATSSIADRFWGYRRALRENHIDFRPDWEIPDRNEQGKTFSRILKTWDRKEIDAYVCNCDFTAFTVIQNLEDDGVRVPEDISVVGFDDFLPLGMDNSLITSYKVDMERMAEVCVKSLIKKINHKKYAEGIQTITGKIVIKSSVCKRN